MTVCRAKNVYFQPNEGTLNQNMKCAFKAAELMRPNRPTTKLVHPFLMIQGLYQSYVSVNHDYIE